MSTVLKSNACMQNDMSPGARSLDDWLQWQEKLHFTEVDLGLNRCGQVARRLNLLSVPYTVITIAGTNGKGSSARMLELILNESGINTGCYTSPHLRTYNERIRVNGTQVEDDAICAAFELIDQQRGETSLTYFEFGTLAALEIFKNSAIDVAILEVGMGGRLDAVNMIDADLVLLTSIDLDHQAWLGNDRESIGFEKAGVFRAGSPVVCSEPCPPEAVVSYAKSLPTELHIADEEFHFERVSDAWNWHSSSNHYEDLPIPDPYNDKQLENAAGVLQLIELLQARFKIDVQAIVNGLKAFHLEGRCQIIAGRVPVVLDVAHNTESVSCLVDSINSMQDVSNNHVIIGMLSDKDSTEFIRRLTKIADFWYVVDLNVSRGQSSGELLNILSNLGIDEDVVVSGNMLFALEQAKSNASEQDRIIITGSFITIAEALKCLGNET
jgi:dihydrofolate synthase/folylpolyglutamate synthase